MRKRPGGGSFPTSRVVLTRIATIMDRRDFVKAGLVAGALGSLPAAAHAAEDDRHYYELRIYQTRSDMEHGRLRTFLKDQLVPAVQRAGVVTVGAFTPEVGPPGQDFVLLLDHRTAADAIALPQKLEQDEGYSRALTALHADPLPAYVRYESRLLRAFANHKQVEVPASQAGGRLFEMRTYESRDAGTLARKMAMFNEAEIDLFRSLEMTPVFFGENIFAPGLPSLTYMLMFPDMAAREKAWRAFGSHPTWQRLTKDPRFSIEGITTTTQAMFLRPLPFSQVR